MNNDEIKMFCLKLAAEILEPRSFPGSAFAYSVGTGPGGSGSSFQLPDNGSTVTVNPPPGYTVERVLEGAEKLHKWIVKG